MERADGKCKYTAGHPKPELEYPFQRTPDEREATAIYFEAVAFSGVDTSGLPSIHNVELVLKSRGIDPASDEFHGLKERLLLITNHVRKRLSESQPKG